MIATKLLDTFSKRATPLWQKDIPLIPLQARSKNPLTEHGAKDATTDYATLIDWARRYDSQSNCAAVARYDGFWFLDDDAGTLAELYKQETGANFPRTYKVRTSRGYHYYFRHDDASRVLRYGGHENSGVISIPGFKGEARCHNQYVVAPGSIHPSGAVYKVDDDAPIVAAPVELLEWLQKAFVQSESLKPKPDKPKSSPSNGSGDPGFKKLFDAVGNRPLLKRLKIDSLEPGEVVPCPLPDHKHSDYSPCFGPLAETPQMFKCLGNCGFSGDLFATLYKLDGGAKKYRNMYDVARAVCVEEGLTFENFFRQEPKTPEPDMSQPECQFEEPEISQGPDGGATMPADSMSSAEEPSVPKLFQFAQKPCDLSDKPIEWVIDGMFPKNSLSIVCGREGIGKGVNALLSLSAIQNGGLFLGHKANPVPHILYVDLENPEAVVRHRLAKLGLLESENFVIWGQWNSTPPPTNFDDPMYREYAEKTGGFIFFDSLIDFCNGADENNAAEMNEALTKARMLARHCAGVHIQHHSDKYGKSGWRGTTAITAAVDMAFGLRAVDDEAFRRGTDRAICFSTLKPKMCEPYHVTYEVVGWDGHLAYRIVPDDGKATETEPAKTPGVKTPTKLETALSIGRGFITSKLERKQPVTVGTVTQELERNAYPQRIVRDVLKILRAQFETSSPENREVVFGPALNLLGNAPQAER
jgi:hypothetical protein